MRSPDRTLLENSLILYGSGLSDANRHTHHDLPILLAGSGGRQIETNRLLHYDVNTPLNNLFVSMCHMAGANIEALGDSTGAVSL